jgi:hypothetical protein
MSLIWREGGIETPVTEMDSGDLARIKLITHRKLLKYLNKYETVKKLLHDIEEAEQLRGKLVTIDELYSLKKGDRVVIGDKLIAITNIGEEELSYLKECAERKILRYA